MRALNVRTLLVEVANNGSVSGHDSGSGLGSKMLDGVSVAWQREDGLAPDLATVLDGTN